MEKAKAYFRNTVDRAICIHRSRVLKAIQIFTTFILRNVFFSRS